MNAGQAEDEAVLGLDVAVQLDFAAHGTSDRQWHALEVAERLAETTAAERHHHGEDHEENPGRRENRREKDLRVSLLELPAKDEDERETDGVPHDGENPQHDH